MKTKQTSEDSSMRNNDTVLFNYFRLLTDQLCTIEPSAQDYAKHISVLEKFIWLLTDEVTGISSDEITNEFCQLGYRVLDRLNHLVVISGDGEGTEILVDDNKRGLMQNMRGEITSIASMLQDLSNDAHSIKGCFEDHLAGQKSYLNIMIRDLHKLQHKMNEIMFCSKQFASRLEDIKRYQAK